MKRKIAISWRQSSSLSLASAHASRRADAQAQDWFKTGTGLGVTKARLAVPDTAARSTAAQPLEKTFHDVLWADLDYSGILDLVSPSFYPTQVPSQPSELKAAGLGRRAGQRLHGRVRQCLRRRRESGCGRISLRRAQPDARRSRCRKFIAARPPTPTPAGSRINSPTTSSRVLSGGQPGIAQTQIAYVSATERQQGNLGHGL